MRTRTTIEPEAWKHIPGFSHYMASTWGRIKSMPKVIAFGKQKRLSPETIKKPQHHSSGYHQMMLVNDYGDKVNCYVHRLVAETFIGIGFEMTVNHKDSNKHNNWLKNLEVVSQSVNVKHALVHNVGKQKLTIEQVKEIRELCEKTRIPFSHIGIRFGISGEHVSKIHKRVMWQHLE